MIEMIETMQWIWRCGGLVSQTETILAEWCEADTIAALQHRGYLKARSINMSRYYELTKAGYSELKK